MSFVKITLVITAIVLGCSLGQAFAQQPDKKFDMYEDERRMNDALLKAAKDTFIVFDSAQFDSLVEANMATYHIPGVAICVFKDSQIVYTRDFGYVHVANGFEVADTSLFLLASISKTFVANAAMQLWENGLLNLDADINDYIPFEVDNPYFPDDSITMRMLLCHTSSIDRNDGSWYPDDIVWGYDHPTPLGQYLEDYLDPSGANYYTANYLMSPPGNEFEYSNYAFALAGYIIEEIIINNGIAASLELYCQDSVFTPLGMNETSWFLANLDTSNIAMQYWYNGFMYVPFGYQGVPLYPCGQLRTSSVQLARHMMAFMNYGSYNGTRILDSSTVELMMTDQFPSVPIDYPNELQGIGWYEWYSTEDGWSYWGHSGSFIGCKTWMLFEPTEKTGFLCLTNSTDNGTGMVNIINGLAGFSRESDMDGIIAGLDNCPFEFNPDQLDTDNDGYGDVCDNCPNDANEDQADMDDDGIGDVCDSDVDGDDIQNENDNCPYVYNLDQTNSDTDSHGDSCDNCPFTDNENQSDNDGDGFGDVCDICPGFDDAVDTDDDGYPDGCDNCPTVPNTDQTLDADSDGVGDPCDNCPYIANSNQIDWDWDGIGNECDNCPSTSNEDQADEDNDGEGDVCDPYCCNPLNGAGDANTDEITNIVDITFLIAFLYQSGEEPNCFYQGDANGDVTINILDIVYLISYLIQGGPEPVCL